MPTYEYKCLNKGHIFEAFQKISDKALEHCEVCNGPVERLISASAFHLKGSGWYTTDYKSSNSPKTSSAGPSNNSETSPGSPKSENKAEKVSEVKNSSDAKPTSTNSGNKA